MSYPRNANHLRDELSILRQIGTPKQCNLKRSFISYDSYNQYYHEQYIQHFD